MVRSYLKMVSVASFLLAAPTACSSAGSATSSESVDVAPATLDEAAAAFTRADALMKAHPNDAQLKQEISTLRDRAEELSGLVARVDLGSGHVVRFFKDADGGVTIAERRAEGTSSALAGTDLTVASAADVYRTLQPGEVPRAIVDLGSAPVAGAPAEAHAISERELSGGGAQFTAGSNRVVDGVGVNQADLTAADGVYFRNNFCPQTGFAFCYPDWGGGFFAQGNFKRSQIWLAPYSGDVETVHRIWNGALQAVLAAFPGEIDYYWQTGPNISVLNSGCCFICACGTHPDIQVGTHRWEVDDAAGDGFHVGGNMWN